MTAVALAHEVDGPPDAPVVVLLGPLGSTRATWDPQLPALASRLRVVRCDARGHGESPAPPGPYGVDDLVADVLALLDRLGVRRASLVGLSLGGITAMRLAVRAPERVDRLALLATSARFGPESGWAERALTVRAQGTAAIAPMIVGRWITPAGRARDPELVARCEAMVAGTSDEAYAALCETLAALDLRDDLPAIAAPTLVLAGADDPATPVPHLQAIADAVPGARLLVLPDCAHLLLEQPRAVDAALLAHLTAGGGALSGSS